MHAVEVLLGDEAEAAPELGVPASPVLLVYTSGTTSRAKAAMHTRANLLANMQIVSAVQEMTSRDVVASVILHPRFAAGAALDGFERQRPTLTLQVPATTRALLEHPQWGTSDLSSLRAVWAESVAAAIVLAPGHSVSEQDLQSHLAGRLARFEQSSRWLWLSALPKTALGKVQRQALAQLARGNS